MLIYSAVFGRANATAQFLRESVIVALARMVERVRNFYFSWSAAIASRGLHFFVI
jgi:hypothetical protein